MQVVSLELIRRYAFEQKRQQRDAVFCRQSGIQTFELRDVGLAVIGRQFHADQQCLCMGMIYLGDDFVQVAFDIRRAKTAQPVVCAQFHDYDRGSILIHELGETLPSPHRCLAADAGIQNLEA